MQLHLLFCIFKTLNHWVFFCNTFLFHWKYSSYKSSCMWVYFYKEGIVSCDIFISFLSCFWMINSCINRVIKGVKLTLWDKQFPVGTDDAALMITIRLGCAQNIIIIQSIHQHCNYMLVNIRLCNYSNKIIYFF